ncbi:MAG: hypothetical protein CGU28_08545 [Candidatus Dactylopiibacterium carminicum]|uniref:DUF1275 domain-containing protein n=1 Tax=Candidatus Dactylopiibacterium carminicum TaxID=857335 RepID=A0A272ES02_9RHOO|nr:DUF1275 domain-containing protein [Candidatus Dactylopiibacterium carminicum]PAS92884.1 MAG: hypothetical protein CGU29_09655 [Candidatus Dactylopiibacterium carminicum]PAS96462.1 MAG: hypothetical protein CGU28_08545 [Candidatus Dactylopiibacterium carminicum]PAS98926.1 MAG: hypothetical protein BSR46_10590 [Candidatus Dactylopiibacterium carminicum]
MPIRYARRLTGRKRNRDSNLHLGFTLAFIAGATNAGAFLAVRQYTSHMTGVVSSMADNLATGEFGLVLAGVGALISFLGGAALSAMLVHYARRRRLHSEYAGPLLLEAVLMLCFGLLGAQLSTIDGLFVPATVMLLCFMMGLQNALVTKLSNAQIRTTHITGVITDIGIELGKLCYWNRSREVHTDVGANHARLRVLGGLALAFFTGGILGAIGFKHAGYALTVPLAIVPVVDDLSHALRPLWRRRPVIRASKGSV